MADESTWWDKVMKPRREWTSPMPGVHIDVTRRSELTRADLEELQVWWRKNAMPSEDADLPPVPPWWPGKK